MARALSWTSQPFVKHNWHIRLEDTISDALYHVRRGERSSNYELPKPGALRYEEAVRGEGPYKNVQCEGPCWFRWGVNRNGGAALTRGVISRVAANQAVTASGNGTVNQFLDAAQFTEHEEVGNIFYVLDDAGAAGAAPEGLWSIIVANDASYLYFQPAMSVATATGDTGIIVSTNKLTLLGSALERREVFGVIIAASLADNYWGWHLCKGVVTATVKLATAITQGIGLIGDTTGRLTVSSTSGQDIMLARAMVNCSGDIASDQIPVFFDVLHGTPFTSA